MNSTINTYRLELDQNRIPVLVKEKEQAYESIQMKGPEEVIKVCNEVMHLKNRAEEHVIMVALNNRLNIIGIMEVSHGTTNESPCNPREIFIRAFALGANRIIILHNHPSGDCTPSQIDKSAFEKLKDAGDFFGLTIDDFIIVGNGESYSYAGDCKVMT